MGNFIEENAAIILVAIVIVIAVGFLVVYYPSIRSWYENLPEFKNEDKEIIMGEDEKIKELGKIISKCNKCGEGLGGCERGECYILGACYFDYSEKEDKDKCKFCNKDLKCYAYKDNEECEKNKCAIISGCSWIISKIEGVDEETLTSSGICISKGEKIKTFVNPVVLTYDKAGYFLEFRYNPTNKLWEFGRYKFRGFWLFKWQDKDKFEWVGVERNEEISYEGYKKIAGLLKDKNEEQGIDTFRKLINKNGVKIENLPERNEK